VGGLRRTRGLAQKTSGPEYVCQHGELGLCVSEIGATARRPASPNLSTLNGVFPSIGLDTTLRASLKTQESQGVKDAVAASDPLMRLLVRTRQKRTRLP